MDLLSRLLALIPVTGNLEDRCHLGAPWRIEEPASGEREIHWHVLLRGSAVVEDGRGPPLRMRAGDIVLFPSGSAHTLHDGGGARPLPARIERGAGFDIVTNGGRRAPADLLCGRFILPAMPHRLLREHLPGRLLVHSLSEEASAGDGAASFAGSRLARLIALMHEEAAEQKPGCESMIDHLSGALFALALRFASEDGEPPRGLLALARRPRLQPALDAMFDEPGKSWTLPALAALCHMSRATFARHFEEAIGRSASEVLTDIRMALAGRKLARTSLAVAQIGEEAGYQSDAAFQRAFKKSVGMTPAQWRAHAKASARDEVMPETTAA